MIGIVRQLKRKASVSCRSKDLQANVRARIYWLKRRGYTIATDMLGRLKAFIPHEAGCPEKWSGTRTVTA